jgi:hypothetical protein
MLMKNLLHQIVNKGFKQCRSHARAKSVDEAYYGGPVAQLYRSNKEREREEYKRDEDEREEKKGKYNGLEDGHVVDFEVL